MNPLRVLFKYYFKDKLETNWSSLIFVRLMTSGHLAELQLIGTIAFAILVIALLEASVQLGFHLAGSADTNAIEKSKVALAFAAAAAATLNWAYQTGSRRLGGIDLFACEISVICRVCLIVDFAIGSVRRAEDDARSTRPIAAQKFTSEENYTPVYDNHLSELEPLDAKTVISVTQFYTYRKAMVDCMRALGEMNEPSEERRQLANKMIYMQYLMYESARHAVEELVEYQPSRAESLVNILCSEVVLYAYLLKEYKDDFRRERLDLRRTRYHDDVRLLLEQIRENSGDKFWRAAETTAAELERRWRQLQAAEEQLALAA